MTEETVPAETPVHESEPVAENPTSEPTSSIESSTTEAEPSSSPAPTGPEDTPISASTAAPVESPAEKIAAEVDAALEAAKAEGEAELQTAETVLKEQAEADKAAAVAEAHRATGTLLATLVSRIEPSLAHAQAGLEILKKSSVNPIVSSAIEAFEAHVNMLTEALSEFKTVTGKN